MGNPLVDLGCGAPARLRGGQTGTTCRGPLSRADRRLHVKITAHKFASSRDDPREKCSCEAARCCLQQPAPSSLELIWLSIPWWCQTWTSAAANFAVLVLLSQAIDNCGLSTSDCVAPSVSCFSRASRPRRASSRGSHLVLCSRVIRGVSAKNLQISCPVCNFHLSRASCSYPTAFAKQDAITNGKAQSRQSSQTMLLLPPSCTQVVSMSFESSPSKRSHLRFSEKRWDGALPKPETPRTLVRSWRSVMGSMFGRYARKRQRGDCPENVRAHSL